MCILAVWCMCVCVCVCAVCVCVGGVKDQRECGRKCEKGKVKV